MKQIPENHRKTGPCYLLQAALQSAQWRGQGMGWSRQAHPHTYPHRQLAECLTGTGTHPDIPSGLESEKDAVLTFKGKLLELPFRAEGN